MEINEATGEVTEQLGGETFRFRATIARVAQLQANTGLRHLAALYAAINAGDVAVIFEGLKCLCSSSNVRKLENLPLGPTLGAAATVIAAALTAGMPEPDGQKKDDGTGIPTTT